MDVTYISTRRTMTIGDGLQTDRHTGTVNTHAADVVVVDDDDQKHSLGNEKHLTAFVPFRI